MPIILVPALILARHNSLALSVDSESNADIITEASSSKPLNLKILYISLVLLTSYKLFTLILAKVLNRLPPISTGWNFIILETVSANSLFKPLLLEFK
jgi:hypothetical protein